MNLMKIMQLEFNNWYNRNLEGRKLSKVETENDVKSSIKKVKHKNIEDEELDDNIKVSTDDELMNDDFIYKHVIDRDYNADEVGKDTPDIAMDASRMVSLLQAIFTMLLIAGKSLHEQSVQIARLSQLSQPSMSSSMQPVVLSPRSQCSCLTKSRACCKVFSALTGKVADMASSGMAWYRHFCTVFSTVKDVVIVFATCNYD